MIRKYRVWFLAFDALGAVVIEGKTDAGIAFDAYNVEDVIEQAKIEIPYILKDHPRAPFHRIAIYRVAPEPVGELKGDSEPEPEWEYQMVHAVGPACESRSLFYSRLSEGWEPYLFSGAMLIMRRKQKEIER